MKHKKKILGICIILILLLIIAFIYMCAPLLGSDGLIMPSYAKIEKILQNNLSALSYISEYIMEMDYSYVRWDAIDYRKLELYGSQSDLTTQDDIIEIDDISFQNNLYSLMNEKFENIIKENDYIVFVRWSSLDSSCGLLYCKNDNPNMDYNGNVDIKIIFENWYYFKRVAN